MHVAVWCIGEYGDHLLHSCELDRDSLDVFQAVTVADILGILETVLKSHLATVLTKSYTLTALMKLSNRLSVGQTEFISLMKSFL
jgi:AP-1 complex subunit gamma-1